MPSPALTPRSIPSQYPVLAVPTSIDYRMSGILFSMLKTCPVCGENKNMRRSQVCCSRDCGAEHAKSVRRNYAGSSNPKWRGQDAKYLARHVRIRSARGNAKEHLCICGRQAREWAHVHDTDPFDVANYLAMCVKCHRAYDKPMTLRGEAHPRAKLTEKLVRSIRAQYAEGVKTQKDLASEFGVLQGTIHKIVANKIWKEVVPDVSQ